MRSNTVVKGISAFVTSAVLAIAGSGNLAAAVEYDLDDPVFTTVEVQPSKLNQDEQKTISFQIGLQDESGIGSLSFSCRSFDVDVGRSFQGISIRIQVGLSQPTQFTSEDGLITNTNVVGNRESKDLRLSFDLELSQPLPAATYTCRLGAMDRSNYKETNFGFTTVNFEVLESDQKAFDEDDTRLNAGSFKGYVALYAKGYQGHKLSAKVGKDWVIIESIESDFERYVEFTGAGYRINVRMFIDGQFAFSKLLTTK